MSAVNVAQLNHKLRRWWNFRSANPYFRNVGLDDDTVCDLVVFNGTCRATSPHKGSNPPTPGSSLPFRRKGIVRRAYAMTEFSFFERTSFRKESRIEMLKILEPFGGCRGEETHWLWRSDSILTVNVASLYHVPLQGEVVGANLLIKFPKSSFTITNALLCSAFLLPGPCAHIRVLLLRNMHRSLILDKNATKIRSIFSTTRIRALTRNSRSVLVSSRSKSISSMSLKV